MKTLCGSLPIKKRRLYVPLPVQLLWRPGEGVCLQPHAGAVLVEAYLAVVLDRLNDLAVVGSSMKIGSAVATFGRALTQIQR